MGSEETKATERPRPAGPTSRDKTESSQECPPDQETDQKEPSQRSTPGLAALLLRDSPTSFNGTFKSTLFKYSALLFFFLPRFCQDFWKPVSVLCVLSCLGRTRNLQLQNSSDICRFWAKRSCSRLWVLLEKRTEKKKHLNQPKSSRFRSGTDIGIKSPRGFPPPPCFHHT